AGETLVIFSRPWFPGYRAECNGRPMPVEVFDLILPAVRLPAGTSGRVVLEYRPAPFVLGCCITASCAAVIVWFLLVAAAQRFLDRRQSGWRAGRGGWVTFPALAKGRLPEEVGS